MSTATQNNSATLTDLSPVVAEINLAHLRHNARVLQDRAAPASFLAVVKADAYGHGAVPCARVLREEGAERFAVARLSEAIELREAGIEEPILVFAAPLREHLPAYIRYDLDVAVASPALADAVIDLARREGPVRAHVKVETGMGRIGMPPREAVRVLRTLSDVPDVTLAGCWTHFAVAGDSSEDAYTQQQLDAFREVVREAGVEVEHVHAANSSAILRVGESYHAFDNALVRAGLALFGLAEDPALSEQFDLRPVMRLSARVTHVKTVPEGATISYNRLWKAPRPSRIATIGVGYGDGYTRLLSNRAEVKIRGKRYPVVGAICMDMMMVDLGPPSGPGREVAPGDEVLLFGPGGPTAYEVARWAETIPYEVCATVGKRVPRIYRSRTAGQPDSQSDLEAAVASGNDAPS